VIGTRCRAGGCESATFTTTCTGDFRFAAKSGGRYRGDDRPDQTYDYPASVACRSTDDSIEEYVRAAAF